MPIIIAPSLIKSRNLITLPTDKVNYFASEKVHSNFSIYQRLFKVFSFMTLNDEKEYVLTTLKGAPFMWQPYRACSWDTTGNLTIGQQTMSPCKALLQEQFCVDELLHSTFKHMLKIERNQSRLDADGEKIINAMITKIVEQATLGAMLTLTIGKLYDPSKILFKEGVDANIETAFAKTIGTCRGFLELLKERAQTDAKYAHLNNKSLLPASDFDGEAYTGDILKLFDNLLESGSSDLQAVIDEGGISSNGEVASPLFLATPSIVKSVKKAYDKQTALLNLTSIEPRITLEKTDGIKIYYIDGVPVVPMTYASYMNRYLKGSTHFAAITVAGNINLGASFKDIPNINVPNVAVAIQQKTDLDQAGQYVMQAASYFNAAIADSELISAAQVYVTEA